MSKKLTLKEIDEQIADLQAQRGAALEDAFKNDRESLEVHLVEANNYVQSLHAAGLNPWTVNVLKAIKTLGLALKESKDDPNSGKSPRLKGEKKTAFVPVLLAAITQKMSRSEIEALPAVVEHLKAAGFKKVPNLSAILAEQVTAHKLTPEGKKSKMKYMPA